MTRVRRHLLRACAIALLAAAPLAARAQGGGACTIDIPKPLTFGEWKAEVQMRSERGIYPEIGLNPDDVREALSRANAPDCDAWADVWISVGDRYMGKARSELAGDRVAADADFLMAWRYYNFARFPAPLSPEKTRAWTLAQEAFTQHGKLMDPPVQVVRIPFEGREIVGLLREPKSDHPLPIVITIGGLDGWRDDMVGRMASLPEHGFAYIAVDLPGTGDAPLKGRPGSERIYSRVIDWIEQQPRFDKSRIFVHGSSFGGYWAAVLAVTEAKRLRGVVDQSGLISDASLGPAGLDMPAPPPPTYYLSDWYIANATMLGTKTREETGAVRLSLSLQQRGMIGKPTAPMLVIAGVKDPLVPIQDIWLLLSNGDKPKDAWINPQGFHMGREPGIWTDQTIFTKVTLPWLEHQAGLDGSAP